MSLAGHLRHPFRHKPLRFKLVALVLLLLTAAIALIGAATTIAMRTFLNERVEADLREAAENFRNAVRAGDGEFEIDPRRVLLPSDFVILVPDTAVTRPTADDGPWTPIQPLGEEWSNVPALPDDPEELREFVNTYQTVPARFGHERWRILTVTFSAKYDTIFVVAEKVSSTDRLLKRLLAINVYGGAAILILAASIGTDLVRRSLRPLSTIEKTAGAIAGGDLTKRVPDPEEDQLVPKTEVGSLARSLNSMLAQIEAAFTARAASETAARAAESTARDAAVAAQASEQRARRSEERMRRFIGDASHELRTPLTTIRGFAELYRQGAVTSQADTATIVKRIEDEARRMGLLVEDLLLLARLDQERPLRPGPVELHVLAADAAHAARAVAPDREITVTVAPDAGDLIVLGDDGRLRQVIGNLTSNALVHTPAGTPVELKLRRQGQQAVLEVVDHGPGLTAEQKERVFERFYRADPARSRRPDGQVATGLGLAIVAALVAVHNGEVEVDSEPGQGATFRVLLPLVEMTDEADELPANGNTTVDDA